MLATQPLIDWATWDGSFTFPSVEPASMPQWAAQGGERFEEVLSKLPQANEAEQR